MKWKIERNCWKIMNKLEDEGLLTDFLSAMPMKGKENWLPWYMDRYDKHAASSRKKTLYIGRSANHSYYLHREEGEFVVVHYRIVENEVESRV